MRSELLLELGVLMWFGEAIVLEVVDRLEPTGVDFFVEELPIHKIIQLFVGLFFT